MQTFVISVVGCLNLAKTLMANENGFSGSMNLSFHSTVSKQNGQLPQNLFSHAAQTAEKQILFYCQNEKSSVHCVPITCIHSVQ